MIKNQLSERKNMSKIVLVFDGKNQSSVKNIHESPPRSTAIRPTFQSKKQKLKPIKINEFDVSSEFRDDVDSKHGAENMDSEVPKGSMLHSSIQ